jgi:hypothetical protein
LPIIPNFDPPRLLQTSLYLVIAVRSGGAVALFSRRKKSLSKKFPYIVEALAGVRMGFSEPSIRWTNTVDTATRS